MTKMYFRVVIFHLCQIVSWMCVGCVQPGGAAVVSFSAITESVFLADTSATMTMIVEIELMNRTAVRTVDFILHIFPHLIIKNVKR